MNGETMISVPLRVNTGNSPVVGKAGPLRSPAIFLAVLCSVLVACRVVVNAPRVEAAADSGNTHGEVSRPPNILLVVIDDLGHGELGCQGNPEIPTPNIDSLAEHGIRFSNGYVSAPYCAPSRA